MVQKHALLIEVPSIQTYVFSSNKLKENIGASYIVEHLLYGKKGVLDEIIRTNFDKEFDLDNWKSNFPDDNHRITIGYIGGGNALLLFNKKEDIKAFVKLFSNTCLLKFPTLRLAFGVKENFDFNKSYNKEFKELSKRIQIEKSSNYHITSPPKYGITADCPWSNENAETVEKGSKNIISVASAAKLNANELAKLNLPDYYQVPEGYVLTDEIEKLGQPIEGSYVAVVHIDGNGMGNIFSGITSLEKLREKSIAVSNKALSAMQMLIKHITEPDLQKKLNALTPCKEDGKSILPIRPILVGGDDVTFVAEGRIGIYFAKKFIEFFYDTKQRNATDADKIMDGACAGVAVLKSNFPFYKAVKLAEQLCGEAKKASRVSGDSKCFLSYYYSATTFSGDIDELRKRTHECSLGNAYYGPYKLFKEDDKKSFERLIEGIRLFSDVKKWPKNKVMRLRDVMAGTKNENKLFETELEDLDMKLPNGHEHKIWQENQTPFFDQIELMEFYLPELLSL